MQRIAKVAIRGGIRLVDKGEKKGEQCWVVILAGSGDRATERDVQLFPLFLKKELKDALKSSQESGENVPKKEVVKKVLGIQSGHTRGVGRKLKGVSSSSSATSSSSSYYGGSKAYTQDEVNNLIETEGKKLGKKIGKRIASSFNKKLENLLTQLAEKGIPLDKTPVVGEEDEEYEESDDEEMEVLDEDEEINDGDDSVGIARNVALGMLIAEVRYAPLTGDMQRRYMTSCLGNYFADALVPLTSSTSRILRRRNLADDIRSARDVQRHWVTNLSGGTASDVGQSSFVYNTVSSMCERLLLALAYGVVQSNISAASACVNSQHANNEVPESSYARVQGYSTSSVTTANNLDIRSDGTAASACQRHHGTDERRGISRQRSPATNSESDHFNRNVIRQHISTLETVTSDVITVGLYSGMESDLKVDSSDKITNTQDVDQYISAELPDPRKDPSGYKVVSDMMIHGPCGGANLNAPYPPKLWAVHWQAMVDDIPTKVSKQTGIPEYHVNTRELQGYVLYEIEALLNGFGKSVKDFGLPAPLQHLL
ncbi:hypothetical protein Tco_0610488 [Tanacetum coccineum]